MTENETTRAREAVHAAFENPKFSPTQLYEAAVEVAPGLAYEHVAAVVLDEIVGGVLAIDQGRFVRSNDATHRPDPLTPIEAPALESIIESIEVEPIAPEAEVPTGHLVYASQGAHAIHLRRSEGHGQTLCGMNAGYPASAITVSLSDPAICGRCQRSLSTTAPWLVGG